MVKFGLEPIGPLSLSLFLFPSGWRDQNLLLLLPGLEATPLQDSPLAFYQASLTICWYHLNFKYMDMISLEFLKYFNHILNNI